MSQSQKKGPKHRTWKALLPFQQNRSSSSTSQPLPTPHPLGPSDTATPSLLSPSTSPTKPFDSFLSVPIFPASPPSPPTYFDASATEPQANTSASEIPQGLKFQPNGVTTGSPSLSKPRTATVGTSGTHEAWQKASTALKDFARITGRAVDTALPVVAAGVDTFPIAKGVVAGLVAVISIVKIWQDNAQKIRRILERLEGLEESLEGEDQLVQEKWAKHGLRLVEILHSLVVMKYQRKITALISSKHDQGKILEYVEAVNQVLNDFDLHLHIRIFSSTANTEKVVMDEGSRTQLERLKHSADAAYGKGRQGKRRTSCLENTRVRILSQLDSWLLHPKDYRIFWLSGMAGTGKSTIADSLYQAAERHGAFVAAFFCSRDLDSTRDILRIIPSLAYQLAVRREAYRVALVTGLKNEDYPENFVLEEQIDKLILKPLALVSKSSPSLIFLLIDALDECQGDGVRDNVRTFVSLLLSHADDLRKAGIKFFLSSRPAHEISGHFRMDELHKQHERLVLHDADFVDVQSDLEVYVRHELQEIKKRDSSFSFSPAQLTQISKASAPLFIFAATVCAHIGGRGANSTGRVNHAKRLKQIMSQISANSAGAGTQTMRGLDGLYRMILEDAFKAVNEEAEEFDDVDSEAQGKFVLASILIFFEPLGLAAMSTLLGSSYDRQRVRDLLYHLYAVIAVPEDDVQPVRALHASLYDYLTSPKRAPPFLLDPSVDHGTLAASCLELMLDMLTHDNICGLNVGEDQDIADLPSHIQDSRIRDALPVVKYACQHWSQHLTATGTPDTRLLGALERFSSTNLLRWIEVLVVFGELKSAVHMISSARTWLNVSLDFSFAGPSTPLPPQRFDMRYSASNIASLLSDVERMVFQFHDVIVVSPIQVYMSAFPFIPRQCTLSLQYRNIIEPSLQLLDVVTGVDETWSPVLGAVSLPSDRYPLAMCMAHDSRTLACSSYNPRNQGPHNLLFWDSVAGGLMDELEDDRLEGATLGFHPDHGLLCVSHGSRPSVWSVDMNLRRLKKVVLDLRRTEEIFREDDDFEAMYRWFSNTLSFSFDGSRLAGLIPRRDYLMTWVLKKGADGEGDAVDGLAFVPEHCLKLMGLPRRLLESPDPCSEWADSDHDDFHVDELQWSPDSSIIAMRVKRKAYLCTLPRDRGHNECSLSPLESGAGSRDCHHIVWAEGRDYLACRARYAMTVYLVSTAVTGASQATAREVWTKELPKGIASIAFSPDAQFIAVGHGRCSISIHAVNNSASVSTVHVSFGDLVQLVYSPDGCRVICAFQSILIVLDADACIRTQHSDRAPHSQLEIPKGHYCNILKCSPDETTVFAGYTYGMGFAPSPHRLGVWDAAQGQQVASIAIPHDDRHSIMIETMYTHNSRELLVVMPDHAYWYDLDVCRHAHAPLDLEPRLILSPVTGMEFISNHLPSASRRFTVSPNCHFILLLQCPRKSISDSDDHYVGLRVTGAIFDANSGELVWSHDGMAVLEKRYTRVLAAWSPNGDMIACGTNDSIILWSFGKLPGLDTHSRSMRLPSVDPEGVRHLFALSFSSSGKELLGHLVHFNVDVSSSLICSWDVESGEVLHSVLLDAMFDHELPEVLTPPSGEILVCTSQGTFRAEELLAMRTSTRSYDRPYDRYRFDPGGDRWVRDYQGRKVFELPLSLRISFTWRFDSCGNLLAFAPREVEDGSLLIMRIRLDDPTLKTQASCIHD
ncbi:hypothetical protein EIP91_006890 [Steccherinum ochraceum]|uniref:NACHT domain-containing protein n=1 Tax=Steccherinum ochraceum TaxID=92696 RepID=A0A4V2MVL2_9APHY|nr:hypothetical protein EIP91_006890 [Steccherinum ochraceum]